MLVLGGLLNYLPHLGYPYPLHVDEWTHFTYAQHISDGSPLYFGGESESLEHGFHVWLAVLKQLSADYLLIFNFLPIIITILISLSIFLLTKRYSNTLAGLFAVLFFILLRSSVALLGPMFLVPLSIGLFLVFMGIYLIDTNFLFLIIAATLIMHPPSGIALLFFVGSVFISRLLNKKYENLWKIIKNIIFGVILSLPLFLSKLTEKGLENLQFRESIIPFYMLPKYLGFFVVLFVLIGFFILNHKKKYSVFIYSSILLILATLYYQFGLNLFIFYERALMYLFIAFAIPFGIALSFIFTKKIKGFYVLLLILVIAILLPLKIGSAFMVYHVVNETEINEFIEYKHVEGSKVIINPWKAIAFTPLAKKEVYSRVPAGPDPKYIARNNEIFEFFNKSCSNKTFLKENNIDIIVGC